MGLLHLATLLAALGCGLNAGVFFAFSTFVMKALGKLPPPQGIAAMQWINVVVINRWFMAVFIGTAGTCVFIMIGSLLQHHSTTPYLVAGSLLYLLGTFLVTVLFNVPRNDALAMAEPNTAEAAELWATYLRGWTGWNHVRTAAAFAAAASFTVAFSLQV